MNSIKIKLKPDYSKILSDPNFHMSGLIWCHSTIFRLFEMMERKLIYWIPKSVEDIQVVVQACRAVFQFLDHHHDHEDQILFPKLKKISNEIKLEIEELDQQHIQYHTYKEDLDNILIQMLEIKSVFCQHDETYLLSVQLKKQFKIVKECIFNHMLDEERIVLPIIIQMPKIEQDRITRAIEFNLNGKFFDFCCIYDNTKYDHAVYQSFNKNVPWLIRSTLSLLLMKNQYSWFIKALEIEC